jgi:hypothetical protein
MTILCKCGEQFDSAETYVRHVQIGIPRFAHAGKADPARDRLEWTGRLKHAEKHKIEEFHVRVFQADGSSATKAELILPTAPRYSFVMYGGQEPQATSGGPRMVLDLATTCLTEIEEWTKTHRIGTAAWVPELDVIEIAIGERGANKTYLVHLDQCRTRKGLVYWLWRLSQEPWFAGRPTEDFLECFLRVATSASPTEIVDVPPMVYPPGIEEWTKTRRVGAATWIPELDVIEIALDENALCTYQVRLDQCGTFDGLVGWLWQLNEKRWFVGQVVKDFLECFLRECFLRVEN